MLTIENIKQIEGKILPNGFIVESITIAPELYVFRLSKQHTLYNPMNFQPNIRFSNKSLTLSREVEGEHYLLVDELNNHTYLSKGILSEMNTFLYKLNGLINNWS